MERIKKIAEVIAKLGADAALITSDHSRLYAASGFAASRGQVFVTCREDAYYLTDSRYLEAAEKELPEKGFSLKDNTLDPAGAVNDLIRLHNVKTLVVENMQMTMAEYQSCQRALHAELVDAGMEIDRLRAFLTEEDRDHLAYAQGLAEKALANTLDIFKIGMTEKQLEAELVYRMYLQGAEELSFKPEIISGANASMPHGNPSDKPIQPGDALIMDFGLVKDGYWSDMSRTFAVGYAPEDLEKVYYTVLEAQRRAIAHQAAGVTGRELDAVARDYIEASGLKGCYEHALGHGIGMLGTAPLAIASRTSDTVFQAGNTISVEPGIYQPGKLGCRIEDLLWLGENDQKVNLTHFPKDELIILK